MKKLLALLLSLGLFSAPVYASDLSDWARDEFTLAGINNLIPYSVMKNSMNAPITREEFCEVIVRAYNAITGENFQTEHSPFDDTDNPSVAAAYMLGITEGTSQTSFSPYLGLTRQEMAKMLISTLVASSCPIEMTDSVDIIAYYDDNNEMADWAKNYIKTAISTGIIYGTSDTTFSPLSPVTREQAIIIAMRSLNTYGTAVSGSIPTITSPSDGETVKDSVSISWTGIGEKVTYSVILKTEQGYFNTFDAGNECEITISGLSPATQYTAYILANNSESEIYSVPVDFTTKSQTVEPYANLSRGEKFVRIFGGIANTYKTPEEAKQYMQKVIVPVWKMKSDGTKYESSLTIEVNKILADEVIAIFTEIFNDSSQFPIYEAGGYSWRMTNATARSEHSYGTCIDLNANENYQVKNGVPIVGKLWKPYENPYSFPEDGIVVKTFAKYGWAWGGNAWSSSQDYMHFSYLGY